MRFGYDGRPFYGWARQPGLRTIEGEIREGLRRRRIALDPDDPALDVASRTDRGVSARANALALHSALPAPALLRALNGLAPEIFFTAAAEVDERFRPRAARSRTYRYFEGAPVGPLAEYRRVASAVPGSIDVRSFGRGLASDRPVVRAIDRFDVRREGSGLRLDIEAPSFVWGMVRKLVAAVRDVVRGELPEPSFRAALRGERRLTLPMAEPEPLVLWEVSYDLRWTHRIDRWGDRQRAYLARERLAAGTRERLLDVLSEASPERPMRLSKRTSVVR